MEAIITDALASCDFSLFTLRELTQLYLKVENFLALYEG